ncbi:tetratricopeptide repeat protein [Microvirga brassicacearum]|uniref:Tetratricopeptide repeat protein n=1 Tax=Microvirga brassicacearum TaxID=2580413 RepID=A0A5N3PES2_9HYPH|nr:tetratricopeptide repeat protein [Microvirga brassicacearum]KAB0268226.1 tetratricopeptide repeat protein [Microvirga brassicacearum]
MAPNDEFIREVDDEYRRDRIAQIWKRHNGLIIGLVLLGLAAVGGWRYWEHTQETRAHEAGARFEEALRLSRDDDQRAESQAAFEALAKDTGSGYGLLARFRLAAELGGEDGATAYDALAADTNVPPLWQDLARLRAAWLRLDSAEPSVVRPPLERLAVPTNPWRHSARELLGLSGLKTGEMDFAGKWFDQIAADRETPPSLKQRLAIYTALVAGGPVQVTQ